MKKDAGDTEGPDLDDLDRDLLNRMQSEFPLDPRPYRVLGKEVGLSEDEVIRRVLRLKRSGVIRRIGANVAPSSVGFVSTLCAAHVPEDLLPDFIEAVNAYPGVTHNYRREHHYNVWFTFIAPSFETIESHLKAISKRTGVKDILNMPATKVYKIRAEFQV